MSTAHLLCAGHPRGRSVVLAHGLEDSWECWLPLAPRLDPDWRLVALDLPWRPGNDYRWRRRPSSAWLAAGLSTLERPADLVLAHSFGANAMLELMCAGSPYRPGQAVLICPLYRPPDVPVTWSVFDRARRAFERHIHDSLRSRLGRRTAVLPPDVVESMIAKAIDRVGPSGFLAVFEQFSSSAVLGLDAVDSAVLVLAGGADPTLSPDAAGALAARIPGARLVIGPDYDHFCHVQRPDEVAAAVLGFVRSPVLAAAQPEGVST